MYEAAAASVRLAAGHAEQTLADGVPVLESAIEILGPASDPIREGWPAMLHAALTLGRLDVAHRLIALLADRPPGRIPPYLRAHLARGRALVHAAQSDHDSVENDLQEAIDAFATLAYPYWLAVARTDLAAWYLDRGRPDAVGPLLDEAITTLTALRAIPALARAQGIAQTPSPSRLIARLARAAPRGADRLGRGCADGLSSDLRRPC
jgi:hypothetical protein